MTKTLTLPIINSLKPLMEEGGIVILTRTNYDRIIRRLEEQERKMRQIREEAEIDSAFAEGERELAEGKTVVASSSEEALKKYHAVIAN